jgi:hypothetical protein
MNNSQKSFTNLENLWTIRRKLLIYKLTTRLATAELDSVVNFFCLQIDKWIENNKEKICWFFDKMGKLFPLFSPFC